MNEHQEIHWNDPLFLSDANKFALSLFTSGTAGCRLSAFASGHSLVAVSGHQVSRTHVGRCWSPQGQGLDATLWIRTTEESHAQWVTEPEHDFIHPDQFVGDDLLCRTLPDAIAVCAFILLVEIRFDDLAVNPDDQTTTAARLFNAFERIEQWAKDAGRERPAFLEPVAPVEASE
jgi:hypothetical protein